MHNCVTLLTNRQAPVNVDKHSTLLTEVVTIEYLGMWTILSICTIYTIYTTFTICTILTIHQCFGSGWIRIIGPDPDPDPLQERLIWIRVAKEIVINSHTNQPKL